MTTGVLFARMPKGFLPSEDTGQLFCFTEAAQDISFEAMATLQQQVAEIVRSDPNVDGVMAFIGAGGNNPSLNLGRVFITLKPRAERASADEVVRELRPKLAQLVGRQGVHAEHPHHPHRRQLTKSPYQYVLQGASPEELYHWVPIIEQRMKSIPVLVGRLERPADPPAAGDASRSTAPRRRRSA